MAGHPSTRPQPPAPADAAAPWRDELAYRSIVAATADTVGTEVLRELVRQLATSLDVAYAFVAEFAGSPARVRTVAMWSNGAFADDIEYDLEGTPCEEVARGGVCHYADDVVGRFPKDVPLVGMGARGYLGVPLVGVTGEVLGHLAVIDTKPLPPDSPAATMIQLFADRARVELERLRAELVLHRAGRALTIRLEETEGELRRTREQVNALFRIQRAVAGHLERRSLFGDVAGALRSVLPAERVILFVQSDEPSVLAVYAAYGDDGIRFYEGESIPIAGPVAGWVATHGSMQLVSRTDDVRETFPVSWMRLRDEGMGSMVVLPLVTQGRSVGALTLMGKREGAWDAVSQTLLAEMAASVAVALDNCVAYEHVDRLGRELRVLLDVNTAVGRSLARDALFRALAESVRAVVPADRFGIELPVDGDKLQAHVLSEGDAPVQIEALPAAGTACRDVETQRRRIVSGSRDELRERFPVTFDVMEREGMESLCAVPLLTADRCIGVLFFMATRKNAFAGLRLGLVEQIASAVAVALDNCLAHEEVERLRDRLAAENVYLQDEIRQEHDFTEIIGRSPAMLAMLSRIETVAPTDSTVLILGETGTGKELIARAIHARSPRRGRPLVKVNCAALSAGLVESELFGHVKGAFTGALTDRVGRFELADGGTIFLDEIGELSIETQVKLLRVMQEREFEPVGSSRTRTVNTRVIAATNRNLEQAVAEGKFRADLLYRLNVIPIHVPPLRERAGDIRLLVHHCVARYARELGKPVDGVSRETLERLERYGWPGNVRELQNLVERAMVLATGRTVRIEPELLPAVPVPPPSSVTRPNGDDGSLATVQREHIEAALAKANWVIEGSNGAAAALGLHPNTLRSRLKKLGVRRPARA